MKKILLFLVLCLCSASLWAQQAFDFSAETADGQTLYYKITDADNHYVSVVAPIGYSWTDFTQPTGSLSIPSSVTNGRTAYTVTALGEDAFWECSGLSSVTLPSSLTSIGKTAFFYCSGLTGITIPAAVTSIGWQAFANCPALATMTVEAGNTIYDSRNSCNALIETATNTLMAGTKNTVIPNTVTSIGEYAFRGCSSLASITIPNSVTGIGGYAFYDCSSLASITIPNSVISIGNYAFNGCSSLAIVTIPSSVIRIGNNAFYGIDTVFYRGQATGSPWGARAVITDGYTEGGLVYESPYKTKVIDCSDTVTHVTIPNSVIYIDDNAFYDCRSLASVTIPSSVISIGVSAFSGCSSITSITIGSSVTSIGKYAFYGCTGLTSITIPNSVRVIEESTFSGCIGLTSVTIPNSVTTINDCAFSDCIGLTSITIPSSVTTFVNYPFLGCRNVTTLNYNAKNLIIGDNITSPDNCGFRPMRLKTLVIGDSVETLPEGVFYGQRYVETLCYNAQNLTATDDWFNASDDYNNCGFRPMSFQTLVIGENVESLPQGVFYGQNGVDTLVYNARNLATTINWYSVGSEYDIYGFRPMAFRTLVIGDSVETLPKGAFYNSDITSVDIPHSVTTIDFKAFYGCSSLERVEIPNSVTKIGDKAFQDCTSLTRADIGSGLKTLGTYVFSGCSSMDTLYYNAKQLNANSWNYDDEYGFHTVGLQVLKIGDSVRTIPQYAFYGQDSLTSVEIPGSVTSIGGSAFKNCSSLTSVSLPESLTSIGGSAFDGCSSLTGVTLPRSLTSISEYTFYGCSSLQSFVVQPSVTSIGQYAFSDCTSLKTIYNFSELDIVKGDDTYGRVAYYAARVVVPAKSGSGDNALYQIPDSYSLVDAEDDVEYHIPRATLPDIDNLLYKDGSSWKAKKVVLSDGQDAFSAPVAFTADSAIYTREFTNGNRSTLYLPFSAAVPNNFEVYDFADFSDDVIRFAAHEGNIAAYTPYLVGYDLAKDGTSTPCTIKAANAVFPKSESASYNPVSHGGMTFQGAIERTQMTSTDNYGYSNGYFVQSGGSAHVNPFRCYFTATGSSPASTLSIDILEGEVGIDAVEAQESPVRYSNDVYDMMGRIVRKDADNLRGLPQGIYIWRGEKVFAY